MLFPVFTASLVMIVNVSAAGYQAGSPYYQVSGTLWLADTALWRAWYDAYGRLPPATTVGAGPRAARRASSASSAGPKWGSALPIELRHVLPVYRPVEPLLTRGGCCISLYEALALVDAIRVGRARERTLAVEHLERWLGAAREET